MKSETEVSRAEDRKRTVLVVIRDRHILGVIEQVLRDEGHEVVAPDPRAEPSTFADPDLLITDLILPGRTGIDVAFALRDRRPELPVIVIQSYSPRALGSVFELPEGAALLDKPFAISKLRELVRGFLGE